MTLNEKVNWFLKYYNNYQRDIHFYDAYEIFGSNYPSDYKVKDNERVYDARFIMDYMEEKGLLRVKDSTNTLAKISEFGIEVMKEGDWLYYLKELEQQKQRDEEGRQLQIDLAKSNIEANILKKKIARLNKITVIIGLALTLIGTVLTVLNYIDR